MSNYSRLKAPSGTYFFTVRLQDQQSDLLVSRIDVLRHATQLCLNRWSFKIDAAVILPNKLHMIWTLPDGDADYSKRWRMIKTTFSRHVPAPDYVPPSHQRRGEKGIWQRRFWEHLIRDDEDLALHMHLIRAAPIHAGLAKGPNTWPHSSFYKRHAVHKRRKVRTIGPAPSSPNPTIAAKTIRKQQIAASESY